jgi:hypothetical protein
MSRNTQYIPEFSKRFFEEYSDIDRLKHCSLFMCRADGVLVYHKNGLGDQVEHDSVGALLGGIWHAAEALIQFLPKTKRAEDYRLSFDTSSRGVFIQPIVLEDETYYLGLLYNEELNPAMVKSKMRILTLNFKKYLQAELKDLSEENFPKDVEKYLFTDISDAEMDRLFSFAQK